MAAVVQAPFKFLKWMLVPPGNGDAAAAEFPGGELSY